MQKPIAAVAASTILALALHAAPSAGTAVHTLRISHNATQDGRPRVAGDRVAWQRGPDTSSEIVIWESGEGTRDVTSNSFRDFAPELSGSFLIWKRSGNGTSCELRAFDLNTSSIVLGELFSCSDDISVAGPHIGYVANGSGSFDDVFVSTDLDPDFERLGRRDVDDGFVRVGDVAGSPRAVWFDEDDVVYWNGTTETPIRPVPGTNALRAQLRVSGARAVWVDEVGGDTEIFLWTGSTVTQLTENAYDDEQPEIDGDHVVWVGFPDGAGEGEIFHYDGATTEPVTDDELDDFDPDVSQGADGTTIAWVKSSPDDEIWVFDGCESSPVTSNSVDDYDVALDGNRLAWVRNTDANAEIWTATAVCDVVCGDGEVAGPEECDDDNTVSEDGCSELCLLEICGNLRVDPGEECDDGNTAAGDGCDACAIECGDGNLDPGEGCDDGDRTGGDGCDESCIEEICGNGIVQLAAPEECDDGNTFPDDGCSATCEAEGPAPPAAQACIRKMNEKGVALVKAQHAVDLYCLSNAAKGALPAGMTAQECLTLDPKGKVGKAQAQTLVVEASKCASDPGFGFEGGAAVNAAGTAEPIALIGDLFGPDLGAVVIPKATDGQGARCQKDVARATQGVAVQLFKAALLEKKALLAGKPDGTLARSNEALEMLMLEFLAADASGKAATREAALRTAVASSCRPAMLDATFPGCAPSATSIELSRCAIAAARCRFCRAFDAFDGLTLDCDAFDDATANASCF